MSAPAIWLIIATILLPKTSVKRSAWEAKRLAKSQLQGLTKEEMLALGGGKYPTSGVCCVKEGPGPGLLQSPPCVAPESLVQIQRQKQERQTAHTGKAVLS